MAKQYYTLEEAAAALGISTEEMNRLRESGELRAFADRGNWKFRVQDIDRAAQQRGSAGDSGITLEESISEDDSQVLLSDQDVASSDSSFPSTVIGMGSDHGSPSDSDVRVVPEQIGAGSDSDVSLVSEAQPATSDSDVKLAETAAQASDSDVRINEPILAESSSSDAGSDFELALGDSGGVFGDQQTKSEDLEDSSLVLGEITDSEINIAPSDSGISLGSPSDSGISLEQPPSAADTESLAAAAGEELLETDFEVPVLEDSGFDTDLDLDAGTSDFDLGDVDSLRESGTQVIALGDDDDVDAAAATTVADASSALLDDVGSSGVEVVETLDEEPAAVLADDAGVAARPVLRTQETEWGALAFSLLLITSVFMLFCGFMMFGLVHNLWTPNQPFQPNNMIMDLFAG